MYCVTDALHHTNTNPLASCSASSAMPCTKTACFSVLHKDGMQPTLRRLACPATEQSLGSFTYLSASRPRAVVSTCMAFRACPLGFSAKSCSQQRWLPQHSKQVTKSASKQVTKLASKQALKCPSHAVDAVSLDACLTACQLGFSAQFCTLKAV